MKFLTSTVLSSSVSLTKSQTKAPHVQEEMRERGGEVERQREKRKRERESEREGVCKGERDVKC